MNFNEFSDLAQRERMVRGSTTITWRFLNAIKEYIQDSEIQLFYLQGYLKNVNNKNRFTIYVFTDNKIIIFYENSDNDRLISAKTYDYRYLQNIDLVLPEYFDTGDFRMTILFQDQTSIMLSSEEDANSEWVEFYNNNIKGIWDLLRRHS
ncbi:hypothetical protein NST33_20790 [Paenibacillus sp. FSL L8-0435]|uniref:hypothetical protein n=1 Tax=Paenibacillus sp. FSL L8-0435 TaxID=2954618 RepID=UPI0030DD8D7C